MPVPKTGALPLGHAPMSQKSYINLVNVTSNRIRDLVPVPLNDFVVTSDNWLVPYHLATPHRKV